MKAAIIRILVTVIGAPAICLMWLLADGTRPYLAGAAPVAVDIPRGAHTLAIAEQLETAGAIRSRWTFLGLHLFHPADTLKAGEYAFEKPASALDVWRKIVRGDVSYQVLMVPEGSNRFEIADLVATQGFSSREEFLKATEDPQPVADLDPEAQDLEGYLFPDSYHLPRHARPAEIVRIMAGRFREVIATLPLKDSEHSIREVVTIASLVEKETYVPSERPTIAGIFYNRLSRGILLQADPTVAYATFLANGYKGRIRKSDLDFPSAYNTYVEKGLPAGPIANPGKASLRAAMQPASTEYMYFVANLDGGHIFSKTLSEHNLAVAQYREDRSERLEQTRQTALAQKAAQQLSSSATNVPQQ